MNSNLIAYYKDRAKEYEKIYSKPERQKALQQATQLLQDIFKGKEICEIGCGTGYWTERIAKTAKTIVATDINETMLEVAKAKSYSPAKPIFAIEDIFSITNDTRFESLFGGFIWSHIKIEELNRFLEIISNKVIPGGTVVFIDNNYVEGSSLPVTHTDKHGNTYQTRQLESGSIHKVVKNFPGKDFIMETLENRAIDIEFANLEYYWVLTYKSVK